MQYIGSGLGYYDSTGVSVIDGDYDWVYITSSTGSLSSEINCLLNLYWKPGNISTKPFMKRLQSDTSINLVEQSSHLDNWKSYFFLPGTVYNEETAIYGRQSIEEVLWLDLISNKLTANLQVSMDK